MASAIFIWWLIVQAIGLAALPLTAFLLQSLPDRGYAFSKTLGLLFTGYGAWLLAMLGLGSFGAPLLVIVALLMGGAGLLLRRVGTFSFRLALPQIIAYEALFLAAFVALAFVRCPRYGLCGPNPWGTERPMDYAFFNAIRYSAAFPPTDPWLAGYSINYYYLGYLMMALVALLSGLDPAVAYNLSLALIFALTALGVAGIISNLIALNSAQHPTDDTTEPMPRGNGWLAGRVLAPLLGVLLVLLVGNQAGALQVVVGDYRVVALDGPQLVAAVSQALGSSDQSTTIELPYPAQTGEGDFGTLTALERGDRIADFNWWWPSRALWDERNPLGSTPQRGYNITEFPFFSFWLGDMHPHVMALPFNLLVVALALATLTRSTMPQFGHGRSGWLELVLTGIILGSLYTINSWDLPTYILLYFGALFLLAARLAGGAQQIAWRTLGQQAALVVVMLFLLFVPFYLTFRSLVGFAEPLIDLPIIGRLTTMLAPFAASRSGIHAFLIIFGLFIIPLIAFLYLNARTAAPVLRVPAAPAADDTASPAAPQPEAPC
ncbi:MAG: hypothetical protein HC876_03515 [Chloroflexaceae bacterium]|nr:hypothetical protein [Chloroflexaceae bacterium]